MPVFCKIRLLETVEATIAFCKKLRDAGCQLIAVHGRYPTWLTAKEAGQRGSATHRRDGAAHLDQIAAIKKAMGDFPILSNGNVQNPNDVKANLDQTGADGIMSAEGILDDPDIFFASSAAATGGGEGDAKDGDYKEKRKLAKKLAEIERLEALGRDFSPEEAAKVSKKRARPAARRTRWRRSRLGQAKRRGRLAPCRIPRVCGAAPGECPDGDGDLTPAACAGGLAKYQLMNELLCCASPSEVGKVVRQLMAHRDGKATFQWDDEKEEREKEARIEKARGGQAQVL